MVKPQDEVIIEFNKDVNMSADELEEWLQNPQSTEAGTGVGLESGHKILAILRKNPEREPEKYDEEDIEHMRKVVGYVKRHLAQENHMKETKSPEELKNTKSTISLKNWGHDPMKSLEENDEDADADTENSSEDPPQETSNGNKRKEANGRSHTSDRKGDKKGDGKKRKLDDEEEEEEVEPENAVTQDEDADAEGDDGPDDEEDEEDEGARPRKKSKVNGDDA